ncbi:putative DNA helicase ino80, partial [Cichlidogyrus casuarinus]
MFAKSVADELGTSASATAAAKKKADRQAAEQRKADLELLESKRQQRKLDFLLTQTELYAHFMATKITPGESSESKLQPGVNEILNKLEEYPVLNSESVTKAADRLGMEENDIFDVTSAKEKALCKVQKAVLSDRDKIKEFSQPSVTPESIKKEEVKPPEMFKGELKHYQLNGLSWLLSLFDQGINGILADEMGLGKTIQTIAFLSSLVENYGLWGPFLIITPASTLHNWTQEFARFTPALRLIPYWGGPQERKVLRKFWSNDPHRGIGTKGAEFHVVVTSYQVVLQDAKFINKTPWSYLVLDEAHAIKNISSLRWNILLSFKCRNRLLLTGTPIQNTMQELWALLHFIMPSLFDSHDEFSAWFSKDIESRAASESGATGGSMTSSWSTSKLNEEQLSRLHMILKPFMLRRVKAQVQHEIAQK